MTLAYGDRVTVLNGSGHPVSGTYVDRYQAMINWETVTRYVVAVRSGARYHGPYVASERRSPEQRADALRLADRPKVADLLASWLGPAHRY
jgi:hypothetical protein